MYNVLIVEKSTNKVIKTIPCESTKTALRVHGNAKSEFNKREYTAKIVPSGA